MVEWVLNVNVLSPNQPKHWSVSHSNNSKNRRILNKQWLCESEKPSVPCTVTIQRLYNPSKRQKRWDEDNWISGCKGLRDIIADLLVPGLAPGQADNPKYGIKFHYDQLTYSKKGIRILIQPNAEVENAPS